MAKGWGKSGEKAKSVRAIMNEGDTYEIGKFETGGERTVQLRF